MTFQSIDLTVRPLHTRSISAARTESRSAGPRGNVVAMSGSTSVIKVLGISGSLRKASYNTGVLKAAAKIVPKDIEFTIADISQLPLINQDLESKNSDGGLGFPPEVEAWRDVVASSDAVLFSSPEYNFALTPPLKNAIDWASRPPNQWDDKPAAIVSSGGGFRGIQSNRVLRLSGIFLNLHFINKPEVSFSIGDPANFNRETGELISEQGIERVRQLIDSLAIWTRRLQQ